MGNEFFFDYCLVTDVTHQKIIIHRSSWRTNFVAPFEQFVAPFEQFVAPFE